MNNVRTFRLLLGTSFGAIVAERLVGDVKLINEAGAAEVHVSSDGGTSFAVVPARGVIPLDGIDLSRLVAKGSVANTPLSVFFTSR